MSPDSSVDRPTDAAADAVAEYKAILRQVLDNLPSGTRSRLAGALGKNRSFVTQITGPAYPVPIPASHIDVILEICHFPADARRRFLDAYRRAHPGRLRSGREHRRLRAHTLFLPDLGSERKNRDLEALLGDIVHRIARLADGG
jgi:hypothetical protein